VCFSCFLFRLVFVLFFVMYSFAVGGARGDEGRCRKCRKRIGRRVGTSHRRIRDSRSRVQRPPPPPVLRIMIHLKDPSLFHTCFERLSLDAHETFMNLSRSHICFTNVSKAAMNHNETRKKHYETARGIFQRVRVSRKRIFAFHFQQNVSRKSDAKCT